MLEKNVREASLSAVKDLVAKKQKEAGVDADEVLSLKEIKGIIASTRETVLKTLGPLLNAPEETVSNIQGKIEAVILNTAAEAAEKHVERILYEKDSQTSVLTGLPNKRFGERYIKELIGKRDKFCWTFFDLDGLKAMNTAFGEHVTDRIIREVGKTLNKCIRYNEPDKRNDWVIHRSGDEFWLISDKTDLRGGLIAAQNVLKKLRETDLEIKITEAEAQYIREQEEGASPETAGLLKTAVNQINAQNNEDISRRSTDSANKTFKLKLNVTASMGCTSFNTKLFKNHSVDEALGDMAARIKSAEARAKKSGKNCVRGYDGKNYYELNENSKLAKIKRNADSA